MNDRFNNFNGLIAASYAMKDRFDDLSGLIAARREYILKAGSGNKFFKQTLTNIEALITQRCFQIYEEFRNKNFEDVEGKENE